VTLMHAMWGIYYGLAVAPIAGPLGSLMIVSLSVRGFNPKFGA
jgi:ABC-type sulfate transport system permease subunit